MKQTELLGTENITKLMLRFSVPAIVGMMVNALYNMVDRIFVGNGVGSLALAGITVAFPMLMIIMAFAVLLGIGASTLISIRLGQQKDQEAEAIMGNAFVMMFVFSVLITIAGQFLMEPMLMAFGASATALPYAREYASVVLWGTMFFMFGMGMNNFIRAEGNPRMAMLTMVVGAFANIALDALFIFVFNWGIRGAAVATVISKGISAALVLYYFLNGRGHLKLSLSKIRLNRSYIFGILTLGLAPFAMNFSASLLNVVLNNSLRAYGGDLALSAMGIVSSVATFFLMPIIGITQGIQPIVGYNYGAQNFGRVKDALFRGIVAATGICLLGYLLINAFPIQLVSLFNRDDAELVQFGARAMRLFLLAMPVIGFQAVGAIYFQAVGRPKHAAFLSLSRQVLILIPALLILPRFFGIDGVFYAGPVADLTSALLTAVWVFIEVRKLNARSKTMSELSAAVE
ncbi:MAG: MATE family efflux transporter [Firmicutes bacterium]|nr:MATE family efflux transporter [Bacillota bacterium]